MIGLYAESNTKVARKRFYRENGELFRDAKPDTEVPYEPVDLSGIQIDAILDALGRSGFIDSLNGSEPQKLVTLR